MGDGRAGSSMIALQAGDRGRYDPNSDGTLPVRKKGEIDKVKIKK